MQIKKKIEVTVEACDACERPTSRNQWKYGYRYKFCQKHAWLEEVLQIVYFNRKLFVKHNSDIVLDDLIRFFKEKLRVEES